MVSIWISSVTYPVWISMNIPGAVMARILVVSSGIGDTHVETTYVSARVVKQLHNVLNASRQSELHA